MPDNNHDLDSLRTDDSSSCRQKLEPRIKEFADTLEVARNLAANCAADVRDNAECDLCLASRSAYFDFYTWVVIHGEIDPWAKRVLGDLLRQSIAILRLEKYRGSLQLRYQDFEEVCGNVEEGFSVASVSSV